MTGERDLAKLLATLSPVVNPGTFVFATVVAPNPALLDESVVCVREREGVTLVLERSRADALGLEYAFASKWITLQVHSALEAVGMTHAMSGALTGAGISANVVAGYFHDHIFVPVDRVDDAVECLRRLAGRD